MSVRTIDLDQKYTATDGRVFLTGTQALVRLPMVQIRRDRAAGLHTGAFISGYRGSPLGGYDQQLEKAQAHLQAHDIVFQPGINEDLAATAVWGSQQVPLSPGNRYDGIVGIWYGKGPGVDRSGDVLKHGNAAGSSTHGGVLCLAGDDHGAKSSTIPHQSDHAFISALMPTLYPSSVHEFVEMGLFGIAMSRFSGCWVGMKVISDTVETTATIDLAAESRRFIVPEAFKMPPGGLNLRAPDDRWSQDDRLQNYKAYAAIAFAHANRIDQVTIDSPNARLGIMASGKAYEDVRQALRELGIDEAAAHRIGIRLYKVRMPWPLDPEGVRHFSLGLEEVLIIEERREIIENQIKQQLFNWRSDVRPRIIGKFDHEDHPVLPLSAELTVGIVAEAIADRVLRLDIDPGLREQITAERQWLERRDKQAAAYTPPLNRLPFFCSGCPHNTSTRVPEGSRAEAGIGCHFMVQWMDRRTDICTHMGGEGVPWTGTAPFTDEKHVFVNLGDGTYFHSGILAIRQAVSSGANLTYKILYNDAVAMTGGQHVDGNLTPAKVAHELYQEGVSPIYLLSDQPDKHHAGALPPGTVIGHRDTIDQVMLELRDLPGCSAIIYEQTCAAEKRRRRKRGTLEDPPKRVLINPEACEGCGDCSVQSNCISIEPLETEFGRKRQINQSTCNKDFSCLKGFCPSFVTIEGGALKKRAAADIDISGIPEPEPVKLLDHPYNIAITGVGGTGVLTIGAILGMAAHLEGKASIILDMAGLAQKGGAVLSHVRLGAKPEDVTSPRIVTGGADLLIAADDVVAASKDGMSLCTPERTQAIINTHLTPVGNFMRNRSFDFREREVESTVASMVAPDPVFRNFTGTAEALAGDAIATNIMMLGFACQRGLLPVSGSSIETAIEMNRVSVKANQHAFRLGRLMAADRERVEALVHPVPETGKNLDDMSLDELIEHRAAFLTRYQDAALADKYRSLVGRMREVARARDLDEEPVRAVAQVYARLLAIKDEYEVARLYTNGDFERRLQAQFTGSFKVNFHLAPPFLPGEDVSGRPLKRNFGPWMMPVFRFLARMRPLRGTWLDLFGRTAERRLERQLITEYETLVEHILATITKAKAGEAVTLLMLADEIRGYGPVKLAAIEKARARRDALLPGYDGAPSGGKVMAHAAE